MTLEVSFFILPVRDNPYAVNVPINLRRIVIRELFDFNPILDGFILVLLLILFGIKVNITVIGLCGIINDFVSGFKNIVT